MKKTLLLTTQWPENVYQALKLDYDIIAPPLGQDFSTEEMLLHAAKADIFCPAFYNKIDARFIAALPDSIKLIASFGVGTNHIDVAAARARGIAVSNTPDVLTNATADVTFGLIIAAMRRFYDREHVLRNNQWPGASLVHHLALDVSGKTLAIIGMGRIGQAVAKRAMAFDMPVIYWSRHRKSAFEAQYNMTFIEDLDHLVAQADIVSLHCALSNDTHHIINQQRLKNMRKNSVLINTGRGPLVDEQALIDHLQSGHLWGAGLDVYEYEPVVNDTLKQMKNVTLLPHIGSATEETRTAMGFRVKENIDLFCKTGKLRDIVTE